MNVSSLFETIRKSTHVGTVRLIVLVFVMSSCVGLKELHEGESILSKNTIKGVSTGQNDYLSALHQQKPNTRLLFSQGPAHRVVIYHLGEKNILFKYDTARINKNKEELIKKYDSKIKNAKRPNKERKFIGKKADKVAKKDRALAEGNQIMRWGEPLSVYDSSQTSITREKMHQFLNSHGYYRNKIDVEESYRGDKKQLVNLTYNVVVGPGFVVDSMEYIIQDKNMEALFNKHLAERKIKPGFQNRQNFLSDERDRVYNLMVNNGYYAFSKEYVRFEIDSVSLEPTHLILRQIIANPPNESAHKIYVLDSVVFVTDAGANVTNTIPNEYFKKVNYTYGRFKYLPKILDWHNQVRPGTLYSRNSVLETQRQLSYLDNFKFINVNFDTLNGKFVAHIFTSPADRFQTSSEAGFVSVSQGYPGPFASLNIRNRNLFRGLEITELNTQFKIQGVSGVTQTDATYSSIMYGTELSITFPQFLSPLGRYYKKKIAKYNPRTRFGLAYNHEARLNEYDRTMLSTSMSYFWKVQDHISFTLKPLDMGFIRSKTDSVFLASVEAVSPSFANTFRPAFVSSASFQLIVNNNYGVSRNSTYSQFYFETGGYLPSLFSDEPFGSGLEYFQYNKFNLDIRQTYRIQRRQTIATRFNLGVAIPTGGGLPYEKYYFGGGSNSIRAWQPRRLGPGSYAEKNTEGEIVFNRERPGDVLLESSIEFRQRLADGFVNLAFFIDAGNVWLTRSETIDTSNSEPLADGRFRWSQFPSEIAVGAGFGIRFDMSFLIFRVDLGYKVIDPAQPKGKRFVAGDNDIITFDNKFPWVNLDLISKAAINIGIGFPF